MGAYSISAQTMNVSAGDNAALEATNIVCPRQIGTTTLTAGDDFGITIATGGTLYTAKDDVTTITVTSLTGTRVEGSFTGVAEDFLGNEMTVTNGAFAVDFVEIP